MPSKSQKTYTATKVYWIVFVALLLLLSIVSILAASVLSGVDTTTETLATTLAKFNSIKSKLFYGNIIGYGILLVLSAYQHKVHGKWLFYIPTSILFGAFSLVYFNVLNEWMFQTMNAYNIDGGGFSMNYVFGYAMVLIGVLMSTMVAVGIIVSNRRKN